MTDVEEHEFPNKGEARSEEAKILADYAASGFSVSKSTISPNPKGAGVVLRIEVA